MLWRLVSSLLVLTPTVALADCDPWTDLRSAAFAPRAATVAPTDAGIVMDGGAPLAAGDRVIVTSGLDQDVACVVHIGPAPDFRPAFGEVRSDLLIPDADPGMEWNRPWQAGLEKFITIEGGGDGLYIVSGDATWGMSDPQRVASGGINIGSFMATIKPKGGRASFSVDYGENTLPYAPEGDYCALRLWLAGEFLVALDNDRCGGMNVTFTGFYAGLPGPD